LAVLLGWSGAVFSYSELIYNKTGNATPHISGNEAFSADISGNEKQLIQE
tara:strand:- start:1222 stop:1371 length:150 start_codon:yes stop_codon:yes gene_type:complete